MMQQIQAALFDLDGTLTNTLQDIANAMNRSLLQHGLPTWTTEEYKYLVGDGVKILSQRAVRERQDLADAVRQTYQDWYGSHNQVTTRPYAGHSRNAGRFEGARHSPGGAVQQAARGHRACGCALLSGCGL